MFNNQCIKLNKFFKNILLYNIIYNKMLFELMLAFGAGVAFVAMSLIQDAMAGKIKGFLEYLLDIVKVAVVVGGALYLVLDGGDDLISTGPVPF